MNKLYKLFFSIFFLYLIGNTLEVKAQFGDTIKVQTFTFGSPQDAWFVFPSDTIKFEKIIMHYKLKCNSAQSPACGEWDYLTYNYLYDNTGMYDSTLLQHSNFTVDDNSTDSVSFIFQPSWTYTPYFEKYINYTDTLAFDSTIVGTGSIVSENPFCSKYPISRSQFLWKKTELLSSGLSADTITGISFYLNSTGSILNNLTIKIKHYTIDSLTSSNYQSTGFTEVYSGTTTFSTTGWQTIHFTKPFVWNGTSNVIIEVTFDNKQAGISNTVLSENSGFKSSVNIAKDDKCIHFEDKDYISVPNNIFNQVDSFITIAFWHYGNPEFQPENCSIFEGSDIDGHRVVNVHLPWSDGSVYWDAGNSWTSYDRISKAASVSNYEGQWNHWAFTKNVKTGKMNIYLNGTVWQTGSSKTKTMKGIKTFRIGSASDGSNSYDGDVDEFTIWNKDLDVNTIKSWMYKDIDSSHPFYSNLLLYYKFNDGSMYTAIDSSASHCNGLLVGLPQYFERQAESYNLNVKSDSLRPNIVFEQGSYVSHIDSILKIDSVPNSPVQVVLFEDTNHAEIPTDTLTVWYPYYNHYVYDSIGHAIDSMYVNPDSTIYRSYKPYYSVFEIINRYEIGRYITPYGNGLTLGNGFEWIYDVSDYRTLLHDSVRLSAGNWQELLDMSFDFIKGIPPRDPVKVENLWVGAPSYGTSTSIENFLTPKKVKIDNNAKSFRFKLRTTGHGFGGTENCSEFCAKTHTIFVDSVPRFVKLLWKNDCAYNPVYPQGGTWVYQRANWCPGDDVPTFDYELTPYVTPGDSVTLDYDIEPYTWNGQGSVPTYVIETQLISYSAPNFTNDAAIEDIKSPSKKDIYKRMNPICGNPIVTIKNTGSDTLKSLKIYYGVAGEIQSVYNWTGTLSFMDTIDVHLEDFIFRDTGVFAITIAEPNGKADQYPFNNYMTSTFIPAPVYPNDIIIILKTNKQANQNSYILRNCDGDTILFKDNLQNSTTYSDTIHLPDGCYKLQLYDRIVDGYGGEDGLSWWANTNQGSGTFMIKRKQGSPTLLKNFATDFGAEIFHQFSTGNYMNINSINNSRYLNIYPNPTSNSFNIETNFENNKDLNIMLFNIVGNKVYENNYRNISSQNINIDISEFPVGLYFIRISTKEESITKKIIKY